MVKNPGKKCVLYSPIAVSCYFCNDLSFAFFAISLKSQIIENAEIISCIVFYVKQIKNVTEFYPIFTNFVTREKIRIYGKYSKLVQSLKKKIFMIHVFDDV